MGKVLQYGRDKNKLIRIADSKLDKDDFKGALNVLFNALENYKQDTDIIERIALALSKLDLNSLSNKYYFLYLRYKKDKALREAYRAISINFYKMHEQLLSFYYARLYLDDIYPNSNTMEERTLDFLDTTFEKLMLKRYVSVYPNVENLYKLNIEDGIKYFLLNYYDKAIDKLSSVPYEFKDVDAQNMLCESYLATDKDVEFLAECKQTISFYGKNIKTYSLLYEYYEKKENTSKTDYYYAQLKELYYSEADGYEPIIYSAIKQNDNAFLNVLLQKIVKDEPENTDCLFKLGKSYLNIGKYSLAKDCFTQLYLLDRNSFLYKFYLDLSSNLLHNKVKDTQFLPISYTEDLPAYFIKKSCKIVKQNIKCILDGKKPANVVNEVKSCLFDNRTIEDAVQFICMVNKREYYDILNEFLVNPFVDDRDKNFVIVVLLLNGFNKSISFTNQGIFRTINSRKILFDNSDFGKLVSEAYITSAIFLLSNHCFAIEKLIFNANKIFKKFSEYVSLLQITEKELSTALIILSNDLGIDEKFICKRFKVKIDRVMQIIQAFKGEKNGKNN